MSDYTIHTTNGDFSVSGVESIERDPKGNVVLRDGSGDEIAEFDRDSYIGRRYMGESE